MDKMPQVRVNAIIGLHRLQDPSDPNDVTLNEYKRVLELDTNK